MSHIPSKPVLAGNFSFNIMPYPNNCGVMIAHNLHRMKNTGPMTEKEALDISEALLKEMGKFEVVSVSDREGNYWQQYCTYASWFEGARGNNPLHNHDVMLFDATKKMIQEHVNG